MSDSRPLIAVVQLVHQPIGGVQTVMRELLPRLQNEFRVVVVDPYNNATFAQQCHAAGLETADLGAPPRTAFVGGKGTWRRPLRLAARMPWMLGTLTRFRRWVRKNDVAAVWFNQLQTARYFGRTLPRGGPVLLYHAHGFTGTAEIGARTAAWLSRRAAAVIPVSRVTGDFLVAAGLNPKKVRVVYNGIEVERIRAAALQDGPPMPNRYDGAVFLQVGTLNRHKKAQHLSIAALSEMRAGQPAQLWICGDVGPQADRSYVTELHAQVERLRLGHRVQFLGWRGDVQRVMAQADVVILPSLDHSEACPMVLAEAMALGKPCIGSTYGGIPEMIVHGQTGLIAAPQSAPLAEAMARLAESPVLREQMGQAAVRRCAEMFSLNRQAEEFLKLLHEIIAAKID